MNADTLKAEGWKSLDGSGYTSTLGTLWIRSIGSQHTLGFFSDSRHCNQNADVVHGGALMTFADISLGYGAARALGHSACVTAQLQTHFVSSAPVGSFISCQPEVVRKGASLVFTRGLICVGDKTVVSADGIWKVLEQKTRV
ncbi:MAG: PaaI family thioesterase [Pseudomonadota bacterium]